jgi:hypothetical protein
MSRHRLAVAAGVLLSALTLTGTAAAFDCIRVSTSLQGLEQSTRSGNWLLFDLSSVEGLQRTLETIGEPVPTDDQAACFVSAYAASEQPRYFAIGLGVAGPNGVLAWRNVRAMADGKGIDHLEASGIVGAVDAAQEACGIEPSGEEE